MPEPLFPTGRHGSHGPDDPAGRSLRRVLAAQASAVQPGPAPRVPELGDRARPRRWPGALAVAASVALLAVTSAVALQRDASPAPEAASQTSTTASPSPGPGSSPSPAQSSAPSTAPSSAPSTGPSPAPSGGPSSAASPDPTPTGGATASPTPADPGAGVVPVIVWGCLDDGSGPRVAPQRATGPLPPAEGMSSGEATVAAAVSALLGQDTTDPDRVNVWFPGTGPSTSPPAVDVQVTGTGTTVDLSREPRSTATGATVDCLVETLVRTVVSNGGTPPVTFLLDGAPAAIAQLDLSEPVVPRTSLLTGGWVLDPAEGQRVRAGTVTLSGTATAFEANVGWQVLDADGAVAAEGVTRAGSNGEYGPWTVPVTLSPGRHTVVLWADSMAGADEGPGPRLWEDSTTFTVVP